MTEPMSLDQAAELSYNKCKAGYRDNVNFEINKDISVFYNPTALAIYHKNNIVYMWYYSDEPKQFIGVYYFELSKETQERLAVELIAAVNKLKGDLLFIDMEKLINQSLMTTTKNIEYAPISSTGNASALADSLEQIKYIDTTPMSTAAHSRELTVWESIVRWWMGY